MNKIIFLAVLVFSLVFFMHMTSSYSNESMQAKDAIVQAQHDVSGMESRNIPIKRVNESLANALQLYDAQLALEDKNKSANYKLVIAYASEVNTVKAVAIKAQDELEVFRETYEKERQESDLSSFEPDYQAIENSFNDERFEDTLTLIDKAYTQLSEIQASQTAVKLFYETTSRNLKTFLLENWIKIAVIAISFVLAFLISWTTIRKLRVKSKIEHLMLEKSTLNSLIKKLQNDYFKLKKISETEYKVKIERFKEMIRDIDRQIPLLKETLVKLDKNGLKMSDKKQ